MTALKAQVRNGRLVLNEPTSLPEGSQVELLPVDGWDDLSDEDRRRLHEALEGSEEDVVAGRVRAAEELLSELRRS